MTPIGCSYERYDALEENSDRVREIINMGCYTQVNSSHVLKPKLFGDKDKVRKKRVRYFLEKNLVHMVASDMHNLGPRPPFMKDAYEIVKKDNYVEFYVNYYYENNSIDRWKRKKYRVYCPFEKLGLDKKDRPSLEIEEIKNLFLELA